MITPICEFIFFEIFLYDYLNAQRTLFSDILVEGKTYRIYKFLEINNVDFFIVLYTPAVLHTQNGLPALGGTGYPGFCNL